MRSPVDGFPAEFPPFVSINRQGIVHQEIDLA